MFKKEPFQNKSEFINQVDSMVNKIDDRDIESNDEADSREDIRDMITAYYLDEFFTVDEVIKYLDYSRSDLDLEEDADDTTFALESLRQYHKDQ